MEPILKMKYRFFLMVEMLSLSNLLTFNILYNDSAYQNWRLLSWKFTKSLILLFSLPPP